MKISMYQIQEKLIELENLLEELGGELTPELENYLEITQNELQDKLDFYKLLIDKADVENDHLKLKIEECKLKMNKNDKMVDNLKKSIINAISRFGDVNDKGNGIIKTKNNTFSTVITKVVNVRDELFDYLKNNIKTFVESDDYSSDVAEAIIIEQKRKVKLSDLVDNDKIEELDNRDFSIDVSLNKTTYKNNKCESNIASIDNNLTLRIK